MGKVYVGGVSLFWLVQSCLLSVLFLTGTGSNAQPLAGNDTIASSDFFKSEAELSVYGAHATRLPFWFRANKWGSVPTSGPVASLRADIAIRHSLGREDARKYRPVLLSGVEVVGLTGKVTQLILVQGFAGIEYRGLQITAGRWKQYVGLSEYSLGTGSYIWSGNALPVPRIQIAFQNYTPVPFTRKFLSFKGFYSDGFFDNSRPVTSHLKLHNKSFFLRIGHPQSRVKLHGGFNHAVQWGGRSPYHTRDGQMPKGFKNYINAVTGMKPHGRLANASIFDNGNRVGNHVASVDAAAELDFRKVNIFMYRQNLVEDGSLFYLNNIKDGLNGISIRFKEVSESRHFVLNRIVGELLYTKSQGGSKMEPGSHIRGNDDYFNNGQVRDGWSYRGRSLGSPFLTPGTENNWPAYADFFTNNNRLWAAHAGAQGRAGSFLWVGKMSFSKNFGSYSQPFPSAVKQFSGFISIQKPVSWLGSAVIAGSLGADLGKLFSNSVGVQLAIHKKDLFKSQNGKKTRF